MPRQSGSTSVKPLAIARSADPATCPTLRCARLRKRRDLTAAVAAVIGPATSEKRCGRNSGTSSPLDKSLSWGVHRGTDVALPVTDGMRRTSAGYAVSDADMRCVLTRVRMRHAWHLIPAAMLFRRIDQRAIPGLLHSAFVVESPWVFHTISVWRDARAILNFGSLTDHVNMVRWTFPRATEIWSADLGVDGISHRREWGAGAEVPASAEQPA